MDDRWRWARLVVTYCVAYAWELRRCCRKITVERTTHCSFQSNSRSGSVPRFEVLFGGRPEGLVMGTDKTGFAKNVGRVELAVTYGLRHPVKSITENR